MKFVDTKIVFAEIPNEITLAINISGCKVRCPDCHSKYLWDDIGESLNRDSLYHLIKNNKGITCVSFMGGDSDTKYLYSLFHFVKIKFPNLRVAWYSGIDRVLTKITTKHLDYIKIGPYIKDKGSLISSNTNQKMYKIKRFKNGSTVLFDITKEFYKSKN